jgi:hypothetical protein
MGQTLSEPIVDKTTHQGKNKHLAYGLSSMQGWRLSKFFLTKILGALWIFLGID